MGKIFAFMTWKDFQSIIHGGKKGHNKKNNLS